MRYHKKIYFPLEFERIDANMILNSRSWDYSNHCLENIKNRINNNELATLLTFISNLVLDREDCFEFYTDTKGTITKLCYRVPYNKDNDIVLVLSSAKNIITIYLNSVEDNHTTLKEHLYNTGV